MPVEEMVKLCHSKGVPVLIDGAHALGSLPLNLQSLKADYYVANAHKWLACPKVWYAMVFHLLFLVKKIFSCICNISNTRESVLSHFPNTEKRVETMTQRSIFDELQGVWKCDETLSSV